MSPCDELRPKAAGLASLPDGDPEREAYLRHARECPGCMQALREGEKLMRLIEASPLPAPSQATLQRASAPVLADLRAAGPAVAGQRRWVWLAAAAALPGFLAPIFLSRHLDAEGWAAALIVLVAATLLAASAGTLRAGALVVLAASAGFAFAAGGVPGVPAGRALHLGELDCTFFELVAAALPVVATLAVFRRNRMPGALAQAAAAGALAGQAALHVGCPGSHSVVHLWVFHVGGVAAAALLGYLAEGRLTGAPA